MERYDHLLINLSHPKQDEHSITLKESTSAGLEVQVYCVNPDQNAKEVG
jgi:hypothetical protein